MSDPVPVPAPLPAGNDDFPVSFRSFALTLIGTPDEVWTRYMLIQHGRENHTLSEWQAIVDTYRDQPAHPPVE